MLILIATISIFTLALFVWLMNKILPFRICSICAGVSGTWLWMLAAKFLGYQSDVVILAILMGGSVVGIAYQVEKRLRASLSPLAWKMLFIPTGFVAVYSLLSTFAEASTDKSFWWPTFVVLLTILVILWLIFSSASKSREPKSMNQQGRIQELENKMKDCC